MTFPGLPIPQSLALRARVSSLVSSLRPTRLRTSVFNLPAHRIPTLWTLYRGLLRNSPTETVRSKIQAAFRRDKSMRKAIEVRKVLAMYHKWLGIFASAEAGDTRNQAILQRYSAMLCAKHKKERTKRSILEAIAWRKKMQNRAILTGSYLRPSLFNKPLPRMNPFPDHIGKLIHKRRARRAKRIEEIVALNGTKEDLKLESDFENALAKVVVSDGVHMTWPFGQYPQEWAHLLNQRIHEIELTFKRDEARAVTPYSPEMLAMIKEARREKVRNKTRERERERRGVVTPNALRRRRQGPPAHVLAMMTEKQRHLDKVSRSVSEVGYVAQVKRALGFSMRDPKAWKEEIGRPEDRKRLDQMLAAVEAENERRRAKLNDAVEI